MKDDHPRALVAAAPLHVALGFTRVIAVLCGTAMAVFGAWALLWPQHFADYIAFPPYNEHLLHDLGAFQIGLGVGGLLAAFWSDSLGVTLTGLAVAGGLRTLNHSVDMHLGGHSWDRWALGMLALMAIAGAISRLRMVRPRSSARRH